MRATSPRRTCDPSRFTRSRMSSNCSMVLQPRGTDDGGIELLARDGGQAADLPRRDLDVLAPDRVVHVGRREGVAVEPGRVQPDAHRVLRAEQRVVAHARGAAQWILHVGGEEVGDGLAIHLPVTGDEGDDHQEVRGPLHDADPLLLHLYRKLGCGQGELVLDLHLRDVRVGALLEGERDLHASVLVAGGREVPQAVEPAELLLDDLDDRVLHGLGGGSGGGHADRDLRRRDAGVLRDRQRGDGERARQHDDDRDDPGEDRAVDEEVDHVSALPPTPS